MDPTEVLTTSLLVTVLVRARVVRSTRRQRCSGCGKRRVVFLIEAEAAPTVGDSPSMAAPLCATCIGVRVGTTH